MSEEAYRFFKKQQENMAGDLYTCLPADILAVDLANMRADVQPYGEDQSPVLQVPIAAQQTGDFIIRPPYKPGDAVLLVFSQTDIQPFLFSGGPASGRTHALDDAVIIGGLVPFTEPLPADFSQHADDFVIAKRDYSARLIFKEDGTLLMESDEDINISSRKNINLTAEGLVTTTDSRGGSA